MKIAIDISPLDSGHKTRGVGFYLEYLKRSLLKYYPENDYVFFSQKEKLNKSVDLIHYPYFEPFFISLPLIKKVKTVVTVHDLTPLVFPDHFPAGIKGNLCWQIQKYNLNKADGVITDSFSSKKDILKITGVKEEKISVAHLAAGEEFMIIKNNELRIKDIKNRYNLPEKFVLYVGDVTWNKNLSGLVAAIKEINLTLVMVGKSLTQKNFDSSNLWNKDLVYVLEQTENDKRFIKLGFLPLEELILLYNAATVFVMPSVYEGFGLPVIEAMQCGCPVVTTKGGSLSEVAGDAAFYVNGLETESIANGIGEVFFSSKLQHDLSQKGLIRAKKFSWKKTAEKTIEAYRKALRM